ncbi:MAG: hypothetical protein LBH98_02510 [Chitinispirillales bacterium]|nr:hypothetical protein [Chitinispirillales bacterium]
MLPEVLEENSLNFELLETKINSLSESGTCNISIDLSMIELLFSESVNKLMTMNRSLISAGGRLTIVAPHKKVFETLHRAGVDKRVKIVRSVEELQSFSTSIERKTIKINSEQLVAAQTTKNSSDYRQILSDTRKILDEISANSGKSQTQEKIKESKSMDLDESIANEIFVEEEKSEPLQFDYKEPVLPSNDNETNIKISNETQINMPDNNIESAIPKSNPEIKFLHVDNELLYNEEEFYDDEVDDEVLENFKRAFRKKHGKEHVLPKIIFTIILVALVSFATAVFTGLVSTSELIEKFEELVSKTPFGSDEYDEPEEVSHF